VLCFFGDGATNQGTFHESLNMASIWRLPILYICENNRYAMSMRVEDSMKAATIAGRAGAYGMKGVRVDGMDVEAMRGAVAGALDEVRSGAGPMLLEAECYRFCGHSKSDRLVYRSREEEKMWRGRDPLSACRANLLKQGADENALRQIEQSARETIERAYEEALHAPSPGADQVLVSPYAEPSDDEHT
jgi:TPP-dependent pyruvate/acetoin dehydrogenase alpha subunit